MPGHEFNIYCDCVLMALLSIPAFVFVKVLFELGRNAWKKTCPILPVMRVQKLPPRCAMTRVQRFMYHRGFGQRPWFRGWVGGTWEVHSTASLDIGRFTWIVPHLWVSDRAPTPYWLLEEPCI